MHVHRLCGHERPDRSGNPAASGKDEECDPPREEYAEGAKKHREEAHGAPRPAFGGGVRVGMAQCVECEFVLAVADGLVVREAGENALRGGLQGLGRRRRCGFPGNHRQLANGRAESVV
jgi:hypothetical protein